MPAQLLPAAAAALALLLLVLLMLLRRRSAQPATKGSRGSAEVRELRMQVEALTEALRLARDGSATAQSDDESDETGETGETGETDELRELPGTPVPVEQPAPPVFGQLDGGEPLPDLEVKAVWDTNLAADGLGLPAGPDADPSPWLASSALEGTLTDDLDEAPTQEPLLVPDDVAALTDDSLLPVEAPPVDVEPVTVPDFAPLVEAPAPAEPAPDLAPMFDVAPAIDAPPPVDVTPLIDVTSLVDTPLVDLTPPVDLTPLVDLTPAIDLTPLVEVAPLVEVTPLVDVASLVDVELFGVPRVAEVIPLLDPVAASDPFAPEAEELPTAAAARARAYAELSRTLAGANRMREAALAQWAADLTILAPLLAGRGAELCRTLPTIAPTDAASAVSAARAVATALLGPAVGPAPSLTDTTHLSRSPEDTARPYRAADVSAELLPDHLVQALEDVLVTSAAHGGDHAGVSIGLRCDLVAHLVPAQQGRDAASVVREVLEPHERPRFDDALARTSAGRAS